MTTSKQQNESLTICKHGKAGYCFDCARERHNQDMLDGRFDDAEQVPPERRIPERVWLHMGNFGDNDDCWCTYHTEEDGQFDRTLTSYVREQSTTTTGAVSTPDAKADTEQIASDVVSEVFAAYVSHLSARTAKQLAMNAIGLTLDRLRTLSPSVGVGTEECVWTPDKSDTRWYMTGCGKFEPRAPAKFCPFCGKLTRCAATDTKEG